MYSFINRVWPCMKWIQTKCIDFISEAGSSVERRVMKADLELGDCVSSVTATAWMCSADFPYIHFCVHIQTDSWCHDTCCKERPQCCRAAMPHLLWASIEMYSWLWSSYNIPCWVSSLMLNLRIQWKVFCEAESLVSEVLCIIFFVHMREIFKLLFY